MNGTVSIVQKFVMDLFLTRKEITGLQEALDDEPHVNSNIFVNDMIYLTLR